MRQLATWLWPLVIVIVLAALLRGRILGNDNALADRSLSEMMQVTALR